MIIIIYLKYFLISAEDSSQLQVGCYRIPPQLAPQPEGNHNHGTMVAVITKILC